MSDKKTIRIGCASGFWGDSTDAARQLIEQGRIDYLVFDYLAEITMSILARAKAKDPNLGYATDFIQALAPYGQSLKSQGIKVVANAGGVNPEACRRALESKLGEGWNIVVVEGDDLLPMEQRLKDMGICEMFSSEPMPKRCLSINAYLGAFPIAAALKSGADIVITGRCVDSALTLGPLVHEFGWKNSDLNRLAQGSLAGHIIECGAQATGGLFTDWKKVPAWENMGYPIVECSPDGGFLVTKPAGTGGMVSPETVKEQIVYEIGNPARYLLPDVTCDFTKVEVSRAGDNLVSVSGAVGVVASRELKASATWQDGWKLFTTIMIGGIEAADKARRVAEAIFARTRRLFTERGFSDYTETSVEIIGAESTYGQWSRCKDAREVILKIAARHGDKGALDLLAKEIAPSATSMAPGITGFAAGRAKPSPVVRLFSLLVPREMAPASLSLSDRSKVDVTREPVCGTPEPCQELEAPYFDMDGETEVVEVPLIRLAHGRSGDKGDSANIGLLARDPLLYPLLVHTVTAEAVGRYFSHVTTGPVTRYLLPGIQGVNFLLENALGGGGIASLRYDPQGKAFAQMLLDMPVKMPRKLLDRLPG